MELIERLERLGEQARLYVVMGPGFSGCYDTLAEARRVVAANGDGTIFVNTEAAAGPLCAALRVAVAALKGNGDHIADSTRDGCWRCTALAEIRTLLADAPEGT